MGYIPTEPVRIPIPFAQNGNRATIPESISSQSAANASWEAGFPEITRISKNAGGKPPIGVDFQGIFHALSSHIFWLQSGSVYSWSANLDYLAGSHVMGADGIEYRALLPSGPEIPAPTAGYVGPQDPTASTGYWKDCRLADHADRADTADVAGRCTGNSATATKLKTARSVRVTDKTGSNLGDAFAFDGTADLILPLPDTIKATLDGNAMTATNATHASTADTASVATQAGNCTGNSLTATRLQTGRTFQIKDASQTNAGTAITFDGSSNALLLLPSTIKATLRGTADYALDAAHANTADNISSSAVSSLDYFRSASVSGTRITFTRGDGSTQSITTQDTNTTYSTATQSSAGLMSAADKKKLDAMDSSGTDSYFKDVSVSGRQVTFTKGDGTTKSIQTQDNNTTYSNATQTTAGLMSASDKKSLDQLVAGSSNDGSQSYIPKYSAMSLIGTTAGTAKPYTPSENGFIRAEFRAIDGYGTFTLTIGSESGTVISKSYHTNQFNSGFNFAYYPVKKGVTYYIKFTEENRGAVWFVPCES